MIGRSMIINSNKPSTVRIGLKNTDSNNRYSCCCEPMKLSFDSRVMCMTIHKGVATTDSTTVINQLMTARVKTINGIIGKKIDMK